MSRRIALVCAMPMELTPLRRKLGLIRSVVGTLEAHIGTLGPRPVVAIATGMGTRLATGRLECLLDGIAVERVVVVGITGAVSDETPIGTVIVPEVVVHGMTGDEYRPERLGDIEPAGKMWTTDDLIVDLEVIAGLRARGVVSLDMESAATGAVCARRGIPWSVFRAISDRATDGQVNQEVFALSAQDGTPDAKAVAAYVARHPERVPTMVRMGKDAKLATERAADAAIAALAGLPVPGS
jgi:nucleoside phosphorylase